jgi:hypothetical protein
MELSVTMLGAEGGDVLANVRRWRQQLGYTGMSLAPDELQHYVFDHDMPCGKVAIVDMASVPLQSASPAAPAPAPVARPKDSPLVDYELPEGWQRSDRPKAMAVVTLKTRQTRKYDDSATVTISPLSGEAGGLVANVNRWREQVGLKPIDPTAIEKQAREIFIDGKPAKYFRIEGKDETIRGDAPTILGVILARPGVSWFVKLTGTLESAKSEEQAFLKFAESIRIGEQELGPGANR